MKICAISDFHGILPDNLPECDLILIGGDVSPFNIQGNNHSMELWFKCEFRSWIAGLICQKVVMIPGNHDFYLEKLKTHKSRKEFEDLFDDKLTCLWNEYHEVNIFDQKISIFGTPYCHRYGNWPFMREDIVLKDKFREIPSGIDILLTHDPVFNLGDSDVILKPKYPSQAHYNHVGNVQLKERLLEIHENGGELPRIIINGHIHSSDHATGEWLGTKYFCASLMDEHCDQLVYPPKLFDYNSTLKEFSGIY